MKVLRGQATKNAIIESAVEVLVTHGYAEFTLGRVAKDVGISIGNLTYHYPTRFDLVEALVTQTLAEYIEKFSKLFLTKVMHEKPLDWLARWAMQDAVSPRYVRLFRELWAMCSRDKAMANLMNSFYDKSIEPVVEHLSKELGSMTEVRSLVYFICVLSEGSAVVFGTRRNHQQFKNVVRLGRRSVGNALDQIQHKKRLQRSSR